MPKFFIKSNQIKNNKISIIGEDVNHIANVLRKQIGEELKLCNIDTSDNFFCKIESIGKESIECLILDKHSAIAEPKIDITIFQGLPKAEKMEFIIQKCTELGAKEFVPVEMERCIVKIDKKSSAKKIERWQKVAETAAKQSGRDIIPKVENLINFKNLLNLIEKYDIVLLAYENEKNNTIKNVLKNIEKQANLKIGAIIGPEGGIAVDEACKLQEAGAIPVSLGNRILRTETAGMAITNIITYEFE